MSRLFPTISFDDEAYEVATAILDRMCDKGYAVELTVTDAKTGQTRFCAELAEFIEDDVEFTLVFQRVIRGVTQEPESINIDEVLNVRVL